MVHQQFMQRCLQLAQNGLGTTYPNPVVGAVIVHDDKIIGEGWHYKAGQPHAEINAINSVKDKSLLSKSTIYVSLEPCAHFGKTPPCANAIVENKIPKVVIGCRDAAAHVNGKGVEILKNAGVEVVEGIFEKECLEINRRFFTFHAKKRPYIILKWAETANHFFAPENGEQKWITSQKSKYLSHQWRSEENAILIGKKTLAIDNPSLNCRYVKGVDPIKIVIGNDFSDLKNTTMVKDEKSIIYEKKSFLGDFSLENILHDLHQKGIQSVIVEGGIETLKSFIHEGLWDEARVLQSTKNFWESGRRSPELRNAKHLKTISFGYELIHYFKNINNEYLL
ncbi:bifunctional diaminohydroxyphosphoribosylaminopyrimidine deaminase/5-amino-6-(5-phosphoribosylamino)uracil reductase RibD [Ornithobacterium rhinotracheale]|uniref:bifunctional diaminohydroxyphosphoribosylaminopyrimidine deaminase/5-amino-6-(5-phosphoribosylamino)uracil reductase RibD n=1 Tax=Ornithobacterium rhinotracheale TaxID=28251 RepID=UPI00403754E0